MSFSLSKRVMTHMFLFFEQLSQTEVTLLFTYYLPTEVHTHS